MLQFLIISLAIVKIALCQRQRPDLDQLFLRQAKAIGEDNNADFLLNSNKIGLGYNLLQGSPICYTGDCQMEGFRLPVFKLNFTKRPEGSCATKLIPQHVYVDCLPSTDIKAGTEIISTFSQLQESLMRSIDRSLDAKFKSVSFSYSYSQQTRFMIDKIYKENTTILYTSARISTVRLTSFEPELELSDEFVSVIKNLPCCTYNNDVEQYIFDYIFHYFGFSYVTDLLLGGVAQQNIYINQVDRSLLQKNGYTITNEAQLAGEALRAFSGSFKLKTTEEYDKIMHETFMKYVQTTRATTLGGDTALQSIEEWSKTIPSNPIVIKFGVKYLFGLLNVQRFSNDPNITAKSKLIEQALEKYIQNPVYCYINCSGKGICKPSGYFQFGICECFSGWAGIDCSIAVTLPPKQDILQGTICGLRTGVGMDCEGVNPLNGCPAGYSRHEWDIGKTGTGYMQFCSKDGTDILEGKSGTICGIATGGITYPCGGKNPYSDGCPTGYQQYQWYVRWGSGIMAWCYKTNATLDDLPGTMCGMQTNGGVTGPTCQGYYPARGSCPPGYALQQWRVSFGDGWWSFCFKT
jgi:hypothetical protein